MTINSIQIGPDPDGLEVTIATGDGEDIPSDDQAGRLHAAAFGWGIDGTGAPYYDANGATAGEQARLAADAQGNVYLQQGA